MGHICFAVLTDWFESVERGEFERKNVTIELLDDCQKVMARWQLVNAWPVKHCVPGFNAESNENAIENMELAHEGLEREF